MYLEITISLSRFFVFFFRLLDWTLKHILLSSIVLLRSFSNTLHKKDLFIFVLELTCSALLCGCFVFMLQSAFTRRATHYLDGVDIGYDPDNFGAQLSESYSDTSLMYPTDENPPVSLAAELPHIGNCKQEQKWTSKFLMLPVLIPRSVISLHRGDECHAKHSTYEGP
ncbi:hypothetical protein DFJ43DRAFT_1092343 [Lentinula guzmanii]|uniref:Uncharacterized protein n=1 Tax=Lentinula guzmanii TaxID=2804957 RepID=A0AA38JHH0_9AGAR|nr:hypothetical protein DFJ43DRAFT_1092343 [Lentinula guzmanii]